MELDSKVQASVIKIKRKRITEFIVDETLVKVGSELIWFWVAIEPENKQILALLQKYLKRETCLWLRGFYQIWSRSMESIQYLRMVVLGIHKPVVSETKSSYPFSLEKSLIERTMQYIKDRTESFDDYFPCRKENCKLKHVKNWLNLFVDSYNRNTRG